MAIRFHRAFALHPGPWLRRNIAEPFGFGNVTNLARHIGVTRQAVSALLNGKAGLSATMALRFEKAFGVKADTLLRMRAAHDLAEARVHEKDIKVERVTPVRNAA